MEVDAYVPVGDWRSVGEAARAAESTGYGGLIVRETKHDPFVPLALAALATRRVRLGTAVAIAFPRSPMIVANIARDLQVESGGRFVLGLGTQVKGHNERRFSVPWGSPAPRIREYVQALRAIWRCWEHGEPLRFEGQHYRFTLMTPAFCPPPSELPLVPVTIAGVQPYILGVAGEVCDGVRLHMFSTRRYVEEISLPAMGEGLRKGGRDRATFEIWGGGFVATGKDQEEVDREIEHVRERIAFYGSTRTYAGVLRLHGWDDAVERLHRLSVEKRWKDMPSVVTDEMVYTFAAVGTYDHLKRQVDERFGGLVDRIGLEFPSSAEPGLVSEILDDIRSIPSAFTGFRTE